jgi:cytochrome c553
MKTTTLSLLAIAVGLAAGCANLPRSRDLANPDVSGQTLAQQVCSNCHGVTGSATSPNFPNLAAQQEIYLTSQLQELKSHSRRDPAGFEYMWGISRHLTDKQIGEIATYFSTQQPRPQPVESKPEEIAAGKLIFTGGVPEKSIPACGTCHGSEGLGNGKFPRLAGQHADYLVKQLAVFQRTDERPEGSIMKTVAHELTHDNITNVAAYLQALPSEKTR